MASALNNLKRVDMPLNKETKPNLEKKKTSYFVISHCPPPPPAVRFTLQFSIALEIKFITLWKILNINKHSESFYLLYVYYVFCLFVCLFVHSLYFLFYFLWIFLHTSSNGSPLFDWQKVVLPLKGTFHNSSRFQQCYGLDSFNSSSDIHLSGRNPLGIVAKVRYNVHFWTNTLGWGIDTLIPLTKGLNNISAVLLKEWLWH